MLSQASSSNRISVLVMAHPASANFATVVVARAVWSGLSAMIRTPSMTSVSSTVSVSSMSGSATIGANVTGTSTGMLVVAADAAASLMWATVTRAMAAVTMAAVMRTCVMYAPSEMTVSDRSGHGQGDVKTVKEQSRPRRRRCSREDSLGAAKPPIPATSGTPTDPHRPKEPPLSVVI